MGDDVNTVNGEVLDVINGDVVGIVLVVLLRAVVSGKVEATN